MPRTLRKESLARVQTNPPPPVGLDLNPRYIHSDEFASLTEAEVLQEPDSGLFQVEADAPAGVERPDSVLAGYSFPLLTPAGERHLFRQLNFFKYQAKVLSARFNPRRPSQPLLRQIQRLLSLSAEARQQIVQSNLRLVAAIARKIAASHADFEELVSEGNLILIHAVDKFDYSRGFRFSTYATHAVQRHFYRWQHRQQRRKQRELPAAQEALATVSAPAVDDPGWNPDLAKVFLGYFGERLDGRERAILEERFGLNGHESAGTLKEVAESVGLSKERVRQLQLRAVEKLQDLAIELRLCPETCI